MALEASLLLGNGRVVAVEKDPRRIEQIKAKLASEGAKMDLQREMAQFGHISAKDMQVTEGKLATQQKVVEEVITPAVEPPGRAPNGQGFAL